MEEEIEKAYQEFKSFTFGIDPGFDEAFFKEQLKKVWVSAYCKGQNDAEEKINQTNEDFLLWIKLNLEFMQRLLS